MNRSAVMLIGGLAVADCSFRQAPPSYDLVVANGRVVAVTPVAQNRFWTLVPGNALQTGDFSVYALQR